jgi:hypothetical protein
VSFFVDHNRDSSSAKFLRRFNVLCTFKDSMAAVNVAGEQNDGLSRSTAGNGATP